jgi:hypothetical protein
MLTAVVAALVQESVPVCVVPRAVMRDLLAVGACSTSVTPALVRSHFKRFGPHPALAQRTVALQVLRYCVSDLLEKQAFLELRGLQLVCMCVCVYVCMCGCVRL